MRNSEFDHAREGGEGRKSWNRDSHGLRDFKSSFQTERRHSSDVNRDLMRVNLVCLCTQGLEVPASEVKVFILRRHASIHTYTLVPTNSLPRYKFEEQHLQRVRHTWHYSNQISTFPKVWILCGSRVLGKIGVSEHFLALSIC
jgi:hypothetical protein